MPVIKAAQSRRTQTPNAAMTTLASPTLGNASQALWRVDMDAGQSGPLHEIDAEQVWAVLDGGATVQIGAELLTVERGDAVVIPAGLPRRITAHAHAGFTAIVTGPAGLRAWAVRDPDDGRDCAVPAGEKVIPAWVV